MSRGPFALFDRMDRDDMDPTERVLADRLGPKSLLDDTDLQMSVRATCPICETAQDATPKGKGYLIYHHTDPAGGEDCIGSETSVGYDRVLSKPRDIVAPVA